MGERRRRQASGFALAAPLLGPVAAAAQGDAGAAARVHMWGIGLWLRAIWGVAIVVLILGICWLAMDGRWRRRRPATPDGAPTRSPSDTPAGRERGPR